MMKKHPLILRILNAWQGIGGQMVFLRVVM